MASTVHHCLIRASDYEGHLYTSRPLSKDRRCWMRCNSSLILKRKSHIANSYPSAWKPFLTPPQLKKGPSQGRASFARAAYISAPAADPNTLYFSSHANGYSEFYDNELRRPKDVITWKLIGSLILEERLRLLFSLVSLIGCSACTLSRFFETLIGNSPEPLWRLLSKLAVIYCLEPVLTVIFVTNMTTIWENVMASLRRRVFQRVLIQKVEFFDRHKVGELTGLLTSELGSVKDLVNENVSRDRGFRALSETLGTLVILFSLSTQLAPILGLLMLVISVLVAVYKRTTVPIFKAHGSSIARISDWASETFAAIRTVRTFGGEKRQIAVFDEQVRAYQQSGVKLGLLKSANESWTRVVIYISLMALYILGGTKVKAGQLPVGTMVSFIGYTFTLTFAVQGVVNSLGDVRTVLAAIDRVNSIISDTEVDQSLAYGLERDVRGELQSTRICSEAVPSDMQTTSNYLSEPDSVEKVPKTVCELAWSGDVVLEDVYFSYPLRPDIEVLKGINLVLRKGTITAIVGSSGAGKSTIVQLLARFYEPTSGRITLGGEDVRQFDKSEWARAISIVNQEPVLFAMSVAENIAYGLPNENVSQDDIVAAAKAANAHDFIISLPMGYSTLVGERGSLLSGGQRQRVAIARALLKNAPLLILDEATSALDTVSEQLVQGALDRLMKGRTTLVIAHRLSTVQKADQIAVCVDGKIAELGSHAELVSQGGTYSTLVDSQRLAFD
ncbi:hypothetical protein KP509_23G038100 [Ceratopteris richardii]|uniref:ABC transporter B family member 28 n=1 Tax=Ceratopteris richardii TaxID=49495 RepID=A0A8T2RYU9_CERRI|nr:hypothetical protein KP509_23G038100 [Ceratopteris richardii]